MRIKVDASSISPSRSAGVEAFTYGLVQGLVDVDAHDIDVDVIRGTVDAWRQRVAAGPTWSEVDLRLGEGPVGDFLRARVPERIRTSTLTRRILHTVRAGPHRPAERAHDVTLYPFAFVPIRTEPAVIVLHDLRRIQPEFRQPGYVDLLRRNIARAGAITVSWPHPYQQALHAFPEAADRIAMIAPPSFHPRPADAVAAPEPDLLLFPSATARHKNHATLLEAMALLPEFRLVCPGPLVEPQAAALLARTRRPDVAGRVSFPGFVAVTDLADLYARASIVVVPSLWEAASGAVFEAFSWGLPVICADVEPLRAQAAFAGAEIRFFDPHDPACLAQAVRAVAADRDRHAAIARTGGERLARRTWVDTARDYVEVLEWVARGRPGPMPRSAFASAPTP
jgi:glycosyltransferase involved in cell wall biosynthesis